jgi:hypothetical protein
MPKTALSTRTQAGKQPAKPPQRSKVEIKAGNAAKKEAIKKAEAAPKKKKQKPALCWECGRDVGSLDLLTKKTGCTVPQHMPWCERT